MTHLDEMHRFIRIAESKELPGFEELEESITLESAPSQEEILFENLTDMVSKFQNYRETDGSDDYMLGVEEGLALAASMLTRLVESYGRKV